MVSSLSQSDKVVMAASNLVKRLPPSNVNKTIAAISAMVEDEATKGDLMDKINQKLGKFNPASIVSNSIFFSF